MGSLMAMAATTMVYIGAMAVRMEQSIGVMCGIPTRNVSWHVRKPSIEAAKILI